MSDLTRSRDSDLPFDLKNTTSKLGYSPVQECSAQIILDEPKNGGASSLVLKGLKLLSHVRC